MMNCISLGNKEYFIVIVIVIVIVKNGPIVTKRKANISIEL